MKAPKIKTAPGSTTAAYVCRKCHGGFVLPGKPIACPRCGQANGLVNAPVQRERAGSGRIPTETKDGNVRPIIEMVEGQPQTVGFIREPKADLEPQAKAKEKAASSRADDIDELVFENRELTMLTDVEAEEIDKFPSHIWAFDRVTDGGHVAGGVVALAGEKGVGKTTLSTQLLMEHVLHFEDAKGFLASGEEQLGRFLGRLPRLGYTAKQIKIARGRIGGCRLKNIEAVHDEARKMNPTMIIYDSMPQKFKHPDVKGNRAYEHAPLVMDEIVDFCSAYGVVGIVVTRLTQDGHVAGGEDWLYDCDGSILRLNRVYKPTKPPIKTKYVSIKCDKNRFGDESHIGWFWKGERGLLSRNKPNLLAKKRRRH